MKGRNKLFALIMSLVMMVSLCATACGGGTTPGGVTPPPDDTPVTPPDDTPKEDPKVHSVVLKKDGNVVGDTLEANLSEGTITLVAEVVKDDGADGKVTWTSSETQVATVSEGVVTMKKEGDTTIRAEAGNVSAQVKLTVKTTPVTPPPKDPEVHSVTIKHEGDVAGDVLTVYLEDETVKLDAVVTKDEDADGSVAWTSSNGEVATVSSQGTVTLKTVGETTIKAQAGDKSDELLLKVANKPVEPKPEPEVHSVAIRYNDTNVNDSLSTGLTAETISLKVAVTCDEGADYTVGWSSSVETVATIQGDNTGATVTLLDAGETVIKAVAGEQMAQFVLKVSDDRPPVSYTITVTDGVAKNADGEEITSAVAGEQVTLEATIPAHKTFTDWTVEGGGVELNGNMFTMPEGDVTATANFVDTLYPLTVVGGTVVKAGETSNPEGTPGEGDGATKVMTYEFAYDTQITIKANGAAGDNVFVAWDYMAENNRIGDLGVGTYSFRMSDIEDATYTAVFSTIKKDVWTSEGAETALSWSCDYYKSAHGAHTISAGGGDSDLQGLSGYALSVQASAKAVSGYSQNIRGSSYDTKQNSRGMGKLIIKNHSATHTVKFDVYATESGIVSSTGVIEVGPNQVVETNFSICFGLSNTWWGIALREDIGGDPGEWFQVDMVLGVVAKAYPKSDPVLEQPTWSSLIQYKDGTSGSNWKDANAPKTSWQSGGVLFSAWGSWFGKGDDVNQRWTRWRIGNLPAYQEGEQTALYGRLVNLATSDEDYNVVYKLVCSTDPDDPSKGVIIPVTFTEYGETVAFKFTLPRTASDTYYFFIWKDVVENTSYGYAFLMQLTWTNEFGYQEDQV